MARRDLEQTAIGDALTELSVEIDLETLVRYAGASGDFNRIHYDRDFAKAAGLGDVIGHGMLAMGLAGMAVVAWTGDPALVRSLHVRFSAPSRLGDRLMLTGSVAAVDRRPDGTTATVHLQCQNGDGVEILRNAVAVVGPDARP